MPAVPTSEHTTEIPVIDVAGPGKRARKERRKDHEQGQRKARRRRGRASAEATATADVAEPAVPPAAREGAVAKVRGSLGKRSMRRSAMKAARQKPKQPRRKPRQWLTDTGRHIRQGLRRDGQAGLLLRASHPIQALVLGAVMGGLALLSDRTFGQAVMTGLAVLLVQLALGLHNDVADRLLDERAKRAKKPIGAGSLPSGNATYLAIVLVIISIPVALQSGTTAGAALLATLPIGYIHNRILHRTLMSFVGWMVTFALYPVFLAYGGWGGGRHGDDPTWQFIVVFALVGLCAHLATSLPDLVVDNAAGVKSMPLRIALKVGAPRLLVITVVLSVLVLAALIVVGIDPGLRQW